ncbi:glycosyltransferase family 2 protein, partial [Rhodobacteraceae bacterium 2376]
MTSTSRPASVSGPQTDIPAGAAADTPMDWQAQIARIEGSDQFHRKWYMARNPEVAALGMSPAEHYLKYGAFLGRDPGKFFDTRFYLDTHPEAAQSGLNPLVHYELIGRWRNLPRRAPRPDTDHSMAALRLRRLALGFTRRVQEDLRQQAETAPDDGRRARAALELGCLYLHDSANPRDGAAARGAARDWLARAAQLAPDLALRRQIAPAWLLCLELLGDRDTALADYDRDAAAGLASDRLHLARTNLGATPAERLAWINAVWTGAGLAGAVLESPEVEGSGVEGPEAGRGQADTPFDRLGWPEGAPDSRVDGTGTAPLVSVLVATCNHGASIAATLNSLLRQDWHALEILVIDRASTDDTAAQVAAAAARDPRIRLLDLPAPALQAEALNIGLARARGAFVTVQDATSLAHPQRIARQMAPLRDSDTHAATLANRLWLTPQLQVTGWTEDMALSAPDPGALLLRRTVMTERLGAWDRVARGHDAELLARLRHADPGALAPAAEALTAEAPLLLTRWPHAAPGPALSPAAAHGALKTYLNAARHHHHRAAELRYSADPATPRPFPVPAILSDRARPLSGAHFPVIIGSEFRMPGGSVKSCLEEARFNRAHGLRTGLFELYRYDMFGSGVKLSMLDEVLDTVDGDTVQVLTPEDHVSCDLLILRYPPSLWHDQRYLPQIDAKHIKVIVNQPPMSDYGPEGVPRYDIAACAENIRRWFGPGAVWHPIGPLVRDALVTHHGAELGAIDLSDQDWHNIIDLSGWEVPAAPAPHP